MGHGVKIGGSRGLKLRLDPLLGPFLVILSHFGPFLTLFGHLGEGAKAPSGSGPPKVGVKWGGESKLVGSEGPSPFGAIFGHFEPFWALLGLFLTLFGHSGVGQRLQVGPGPLQLG